MTPPAQFWQSLDGILVINLIHRTDRWEKFLEKTETFIPREKLHRIDAILGTSIPGYGEKPWFSRKTPASVSRIRAGSVGCMLSHRKAIAYAKEQGWKNVLILEDDAEFLQNFCNISGERIAHYLQQTPNWDMFFLGFYQKKQYYTVIEAGTLPANTLFSSPAIEEAHHFEIIRLRGPLLLHAYVVNSSFYDTLLKGLPTEKTCWQWNAYWGSIDSWIQNWLGRQAQTRIWGISPNQVVQQVIYSDICGRILTPEEVACTHRPRKYIPLPLSELEKKIPLQWWEIIQQTTKRLGRLLRARLRGFRQA